MSLRKQYNVHLIKAEGMHLLKSKNSLVPLIRMLSSGSPPHKHTFCKIASGQNLSSVFSCRKLLPFPLFNMGSIFKQVNLLREEEIELILSLGSSLFFDPVIVVLKT